jgi:putative acetyltransferase
MARLVEATAAPELDAVRALFAEYARSVDEPVCFPGFERELAELPQGYVAVLLAQENGAAAGCVALDSLPKMRALPARAHAGRAVLRAQPYG